MAEPLVIQVKAEGVDSATKSLQNLGTAADKASTSTQNLNRATSAANDSYRGLGGGVRNASYQLSDFVVQVQGGTSALRAMGQQLPQLLAGFGLFGVVAGLASTVVISIIENFDLFATKADKASKSLEKFGKELEKATALGDDVAKFAKDFNATAADGFVEYVKAYNKASESQRKEMDLWLQKKLLVEEQKLNDLATEAQGRQIDFGAAMGGSPNGTTQFDPTLERQVELETLYRKQADSVRRLQAAIKGDMATAIEGNKVTEQSVIGIQQKIDAIRAEAQYIGINNAEKEKAIVMAELEASAKRSGLGLNKQLVEELKTEIDLKHKALQTAEIEKYAKAQETANNILREQGSAVTMTTREYQKLVEQKQLEGVILEKTVGWNREEIAMFRERAQQYLAEKQAIDDINDARKRTFTGGALESIKKYGEDASNIGAQVGNAFTNAFRGMEDAIVQFTMTGKASFSSFALSVVADIQRILVRQALIGGGSAGGGFGGLIGMGTSLAAAYFGGAGDSSAIAAGGSGGGGAFTGSGNFSVPSYAVGTNYVPNDQLAMIHKGEAIIPAAYNTGGGMGGTNNVTVQVNMNGSDQTTASNQDAAKLGNLISSVVKATIIKEQRNGGLLSGA